MKKAPASKKSPKTTKRPAAKVAKKPAVKSATRKAANKKPAKKPVGARKVMRQAMAAFDPRHMSCGCCCPGAMGAGMCGEPSAKPRKRKK